MQAFQGHAAQGTAAAQFLQPLARDPLGDHHEIDSLLALRQAMKNTPALTRWAAERIVASKNALAAAKRAPRAGSPDLGALYTGSTVSIDAVPEELRYAPGSSVTLRDALGVSLNVINQRTHGAVLAASADLLGSTSVTQVNKGFPEGFYNPYSNPQSRLLAAGGICEDAMAGVCSGLAAFGRHAECGAGIDQGSFERAHVRTHREVGTAQVHDRIEHEVTGPVVRDLAAPLDAVPKTLVKSFSLPAFYKLEEHASAFAVQEAKSRGKELTPSLASALVKKVEALTASR